MKNLMLTLQIKTDDDIPIIFFYTGVEEDNNFGHRRWRGEQYAKLFDKVEMDILLNDPTKATHSEHYSRKVMEKINNG